jgi:SWIM zinc finger
MTQRTKILPVIVKYRNEDAWSVSSDSDDNLRYKVTLHSCECKAFQFRDGYCKHMEKVFAMLADGVESILKGDDKESLVRLLEKSIDVVREEKQKKVTLSYEP